MTKKEMLDIVDSIGFPVCLMGVIVLWSKIVIGAANFSDKIMFFIATIGMMFMWVRNRKELSK